MTSWFKLQYLWIVVAVVVGVVAVTLVGGSSSGKNPTQPSAPSSTATHTPAAEATVPAPTEPNPSSTQAAKSRLDSRVKAFTAAYFSVSPPKGITDIDQGLAQSSANVRQAVRPFSTAHFMATAPFGYALYGTPLDRLFMKNQTTITARPETGLVDSRITADKAVGTVMVHYSKSDTNGSIDLGDKPQRLILVRQGSTWFVDSAPLT